MIATVKPSVDLTFRKVFGRNPPLRQQTTCPNSLSPFLATPQSGSEKIHASTDRIRYRVGEQTGTPVMLADASGIVRENNRVFPFGEPWSQPVASENSQKFTSYQRDEESGEAGLDYAMARYYASRSGRFMTPDPGHVGGDPNDPQSWNAYGYSRNDPVNLVDPSGLDYDICFDGFGCQTLPDDRYYRYQSWARRVHLPDFVDFGQILGFSCSNGNVGDVEEVTDETFTVSVFVDLIEDCGTVYRHHQDNAIEPVGGPPLWVASAGALMIQRAAAPFVATPVSQGTTIPTTAAVKLLPPHVQLTQGVLEHIAFRHWATSGAKGAGKFVIGTTVRDLRSMIYQTVSAGVSRPNTLGRVGTIFEYNFGRKIGTDIAGNTAYSLRVVVLPNGNVVTAFPF